MKSHILTMIILSASAGGFRAEAQTFGNAVNYKVGSSPYSVVAADVNGDGKVDLISADEGSSTLTILTNNGSGILSSNATCHGLSNPESVVSADVNQDGKVDLIAVCGGTRRLSVLTNDGSGGFVISGNYIGGDYPYLAIAEDVNGDGEKDLIGGNGNSLVVLTNVGDGNFVLASSPGTHGWSFTSGDFNGDGKLDLVQTGASMVPTYHGYFMILTNSGNGTFSLSFTNSISTLWPGAISAADLNGDRKVDLVIPDYNSTEGTNLIVFTNNGTGFLAFDSTYAVTRGPECVIAEDVNGDGKKDLISTSWNLDSTFNGLSILINNGSGKFVLASSSNIGDQPIWVAAADLNNDGKLDLATANRGSNNISVLLNDSVFPSPNSTPTLKISRSVHHMRVSWPSDSAGWSLWQNSDLRNQSWTPSGYSGFGISDDGTNKSIIVIPAAEWLYFCLRHP